MQGYCCIKAVSLHSHISFMKTKKLLTTIITLLLALVLAGCGGSGTVGETGTGVWDEHLMGSMELKYADQFHVDHYEDGISVVTDTSESIVLRIMRLCSRTMWISRSNLR